MTSRPFPLIVGLSMVKNEMDIIEPFVRHNLTLLDHLVILDNGSVDDTPHILRKLQKEFGGALILEEDPELAYYQSERMTSILSKYQAIIRGDYMVLLDADEFLWPQDRDALVRSLQCIPRMGIGLVQWRTHVLTPQDTINNDPPRSMRKFRKVEQPCWHKAILFLCGDSADNLVVCQGNHSVKHADGRALPHVELDGLCLRHFPVRNSDQLIAKSIVGWIAYMARDPNARITGEGQQWCKIYDQIVAGARIDHEALCLNSMQYAQFADGTEAEDDCPDGTLSFNYARKYSDGKSMGAIQVIARSWECSLAASKQTKPKQRRKLFVDVGANLGRVSKRFSTDNPGWEIVLIEPNSELIPKLHNITTDRPCSVIWAAVTTHYGHTTLYKSKHHEASTIVRDKMEHPDSGWSPIDYSSGYRVPALDFSDWLRNNVDADDKVIVTMDIEGAEYEVIERLIADDTIRLITTLYCAWHSDRFPTMPPERHAKLLCTLSHLVDLRSWA